MSDLFQKIHDKILHVSPLPFFNMPLLKCGLMVINGYYRTRSYSVLACK